MYKTGLVSITFRGLSPEEIINLVKKAGLHGIEWGGDVHVPHGRIDTATEVGRKTRDAGMEVCSYGSYYRLAETPELSFDDVLQTALALETDIVRVWAGKKGSSEATEDYWKAVADEARILARKSADAGIKLATEWHGNTLTDTAEAAARLFEMVDDENLATYWQPRGRMAPETCLNDMEAALPRLVGLHVFNWHVKTRERLPLEEAAETWGRYLKKAKTAGDIYAMLEFVRNDDPEQFLEDAECLKKLIDPTLQEKNE